MNKEHFDKLQLGSKYWNSWRSQNTEQTINLRNSQLSRRNLSRFDFRNVDLSRADLTRADLTQARLEGALLGEATLLDASLPKGHLSEVVLTKSDLGGMDFSASVLRDAQLNQTNLKGTNFSGSDLTNVSFVEASAISTDFSRAVLTGACIENWRVSSDTNLDDITCDYIYLKACEQERRPSDENTKFSPGEFAALVRKCVETIDLIFSKGIDWPAFFQAFQELRSQYADQDIFIQAIEKKSGEALVVRLAVPLEADKSAIENSAKQLYEIKLVLMEQRYRTELQAKEREISLYKQENANLMKITELLASNPMMSESNLTIYGPVVGSVAGFNTGSMSSIQNNYGSSAADIARLIMLLHSQVQTFSGEPRDEALDVLTALKSEVERRKPDPNRVGRWLKKLLLAGSAASAIAGGAAAFSGNLNEVTSNVYALAEIIGIPLEQIQPSEIPEP